jgi:hypothetical protein
VSDAIKLAFDEECRGVSEAVLVQSADPAYSGVPRDDLLVSTGYSIGLEIGLAVAVADIVGARRLQAWFTRHVQQSDPAALAARDRMARNYLRALARGMDA